MLAPQEVKGQVSQGATELSVLSVGTRRHAWPFSRGLVIETLLNAGASQEQAIATAQQVEQLLRQRGKKVISPAHLQDVLAECARDTVGPQIAERVASQTPAFMDILVQTKKNELPFSRGILARTLEDAGLSSADAYATATAADTELRCLGVRHITGEDLDNRLEDLLGHRYGEHMRLTFKYLRNNRGRLLVVGRDQHLPTAFSKGVLSQSLLAAGVAPDVARRVARITQRDLRGKDDRVVQRQKIREKVEGLLRAEVGPEVSARYRLLRVIRRPPRPLIVLLGGVSGTGKSFLAAELAYRLGISRVVSTDSIREVMRAMVSPALVPTLHSSTFNAWEALVPPSRQKPPHPTQEELMAGFQEQVQQVSVGLRAVIDRTVQENTSIVLEGVHLVPGYLRPESFSNALIVPILVMLPDAEEHHRHFESRDEETAASRPLHRYLKYFSEIRAMQEELETLALQEGVPLLNGQALDESADQAVELVLRQVMQQLTPEERLALLGEDALPWPEVGPEDTNDTADTEED